MYEHVNDEMYIFHTHPFGQQPPTPTYEIKYKKAKLNLVESKVESLTPAITVLRKPGVNLNNVTSTKDYVDPESSIVIAASEHSGARNAYYTSIVMHAQTETGGSSNSTLVATTSADLLAKKGHLYLAAIVTNPPRPVSIVEGLGLTNWLPVAAAQCSGQNETQIAVWRAYGTPTGNGPVTATLASPAPTNAVIAVSRYSGVNADGLANPIGTPVSHNTNGPNGACTGGSPDPGYSFPLIPETDGAVMYAAVARLDQAHTPGTTGPIPFTEREDESQGSGSDTAGVAVEDTPALAAGESTVVNGTLSGSVNWAAIAIELKPPHDLNP